MWASAGPGSTAEGGLSDLSRLHAGALNGLSGGPQLDSSRGLTALQAMLWKYIARCALPEGQELAAPDAATGKHLKFPGLFGLAPEWRDGTCDSACQEKVSSCLIALTNRTGKHVQLSILSFDPAMGKQVAPNESDLAFPHQEGMFFGNIFSGEAFACQGRNAEKGAQVKRFCAVDPPTCSGLARFTSAGPCQKACRISCSRLSDGSERCAAVSCKDPAGRQWNHPITTYLRNRIEAANADSVRGARISEQGIDRLGSGTEITFKQVDFGPPGRSVGTFAASLVGGARKGRIELWVDGQGRISILELHGLASGSSRQREETTSLAGVSGTHDVTLKVVSGKDLGRLTAVEFR